MAQCGVESRISQSCICLGPSFKIIDGSVPGPGRTFAGLFGDRKGFLSLWRELYYRVLPFIFLKTTVNSSKMVALGLDLSHLHEAPPPPHRQSYEQFHVKERGPRAEKEWIVVVAVCLAGTRGVHRCYRLFPEVLIRQFFYFLSFFFFLLPAPEPRLVSMQVLFHSRSCPKNHNPGQLISVFFTKGEG